MKRNYKKKPLREKYCDECGNIFNPKNGQQRFCSKECLVIATRKPYLVIFERDKFRCIYCGISSIEDGIRLHVDHVIPVSKGGESVAGNLVTSCLDCNQSKYIREFSQDIIARISSEITKRNMRCGIGDKQIINIPDQRLKINKEK